MANAPALNTNDSKPNAKFVADFHTHADTDGSMKAIHHTLGPGANQAAPGNHTHDGGQSAILDPETDSGWVDITVNTGFAAISVGEKPQVRKIGNKIWLRGGINGTGITASGSFGIVTIPDGFRPPVAMVVAIGSSTASALSSANINAAGLVTLRANSVVGSYYKLDGIAYLAD